MTAEVVAVGARDAIVVDQLERPAEQLAERQRRRLGAGRGIARVGRAERERGGHRDRRHCLADRHGPPYSSGFSPGTP